jgi:hypothetical protein
VTDFDDPPLRGAMRAFLRAADALDEAVTSSSPEGSRDIIDRADAKILAEMTLRKHLEDAGWTAPREVPAENED